MTETGIDRASAMKGHAGRRARRILAIAGGGAAGYLLVVLIGPSLGGVDPVSDVRTEIVMAKLDPDDLAVATRGGGLVLQGDELRESSRHVFWPQEVYRGAIEAGAVERLIEAGAVERLIEAGKGASLEYRLREPARSALLGHLRDLDTELRDLNIMIASENEATKKKLRDDPSGHVKLAVRPWQNDANWPKLQAAFRETSGGKGAVWGDPLPEGGGEIHHIIRWRDWPALKRLHDERHAILREREQRVASWIARRLRAAGLGILDPTPMK